MCVRAEKALMSEPSLLVYVMNSLILSTSLFVYVIAPDKAVYCVFTQFRGPENAIKLISVRTKTQ